MSNYLEERRKQKQFGKKKEDPKRYYLPKKGEKKIAEEKKRKEDGTDAAEDKWFDDQREEMTGFCAHCGGKSEKHNDKTFRNSAHHLFEKRKTMFPSVRLHPDNSLELCFFGNSCHTNFHGGKITWKDLLAGPARAQIIEKAVKIIPVLTAEELKRVPKELLDVIGEEK